MGLPVRIKLCVVLRFGTFYFFSNKSKRKESIFIHSNSEPASLNVKKDIDRAYNGDIHTSKDFEV